MRDNDNDRRGQAPCCSQNTPLTCGFASSHARVGRFASIATEQCRYGTWLVQKRRSPSITNLGDFPNLYGQRLWFFIFLLVFFANSKLPSMRHWNVAEQMDVGSVAAAAAGLTEGTSHAPQQTATLPYTVCSALSSINPSSVRALLKPSTELASNRLRSSSSWGGGCT